MKVKPMSLEQLREKNRVRLAAVVANSSGSVAGEKIKRETLDSKVSRKASLTTAGGVEVEVRGKKAMKDSTGLKVTTKRYFSSESCSSSLVSSSSSSSSEEDEKEDGEKVAPATKKKGFETDND